MSVIGEIAGGIGGSLITGLFNSREAEKNRYFQEDMYRLAVKNNREDADTAYQRTKELTAQNVENQRMLRRTAFQDTIDGAKGAGVNIGMALAGGAGAQQRSGKKGRNRSEPSINGANAAKHCRKPREGKHNAVAAGANNSADEKHRKSNHVARYPKQDSRSNQ